MRFCALFKAADPGFQRLAHLGVRALGSGSRV